MLRGSLDSFTRKPHSFLLVFHTAKLHLQVVFFYDMIKVELLTQLLYLMKGLIYRL